MDFLNFCKHYHDEIERNKNRYIEEDVLYLDEACTMKAGYPSEKRHLFTKLACLVKNYPSINNDKLCELLSDDKTTWEWFTCYKRCEIKRKGKMYSVVNLGLRKRPLGQPMKEFLVAGALYSNHEEKMSAFDRMKKLDWFSAYLFSEKLGEPVASFDKDMRIYYPLLSKYDFVHILPEFQTAIQKEIKGVEVEIKDAPIPAISSIDVVHIEIPRTNGKELIN